MKTKDLIFIALCTALIAVCSWICIPASVPITMQVFAIFFAISFLGGKSGTISVLLYILLGIIGLPVFAGFTGSVGVLIGPLGGFIIGFLVAAIFYWIVEIISKKNKKILNVAIFIGLLLCYIVGVLWYLFASSIELSEMSIFSAVLLCVVPYVIPDVLKILLALYLAKILRTGQFPR